MDNGLRRGLLYGGAVAALAGLYYIGFVHKADADPMTMLGSARVQLLLAYGMPVTGKDGLPLKAREQLLLSAANDLAMAAREEPDSPVLVEFQGFLLSLRGDLRGAAVAYQHARSLPGCDAEQHDTLVFNEARALSDSGDLQNALKVFANNGASVQKKYSAQLTLEESALLQRLHRNDEAQARLDQLMISSDQPMIWLDVGIQYLALGRIDAADTALAKAGITVPIADYHRALLKLTGGEVDTCLSLIERAMKASPTEVMRLLRKDAIAWQALAGNARFEQMYVPVTAAPGR
ncbi:MAG: hypothetical protein EXS02_10760 [Planctomycetes bacterium]|nr:hypothetical protein [Planctomycetota bacterium]